MVQLNESLTAPASSSNQAGAAPARGPQNHNDNHDGDRTTQNGRIPGQLSLDRREYMILQYMNVTRMRREHAVRCLEATDFDLAQALDIFDAMKELDVLHNDLFIS